MGPVVFQKWQEQKLDGELASHFQVWHSWRLLGVSFVFMKWYKLLQIQCGIIYVYFNNVLWTVSEYYKDTIKYFHNNIFFMLNIWNLPSKCKHIQTSRAVLKSLFGSRVCSKRGLIFMFGFFWVLLFNVKNSSDLCCRLYNHIQQPSKLGFGCDYCLFKVNLLLFFFFLSICMNILCLQSDISSLLSSDNVLFIIYLCWNKIRVGIISLPQSGFHTY